MSRRKKHHRLGKTPGTVPNEKMTPDRATRSDSSIPSKPRTNPHATTHRPPPRPTRLPRKT